MPRPSIHPPLTKSYAIDQIEDVEQLRKVAHLMWEAFTACHAQYAHVLAGLLHGGCAECRRAFADGGSSEPCAKYKAWQARVSDGFGSV